MTKTIHSFKSVWDALADTPEQAANLRARCTHAADHRGHRDERVDAGGSGRHMRGDSAADE